MNSASTSGAADTAALWAARLDGSDLTFADRQELQAWLDADPTHRDLLSQYCQFATDLEERLPNLLAEGRIEVSTAPAPVRRASRLGWWLGATTAFAASGAAAFVIWASPRSQHESIATPVAQRQSLALADGSHVDLDARTSLQVEITPTARRIRLAEGQAFFAVTKDAERPFVVETPAGAVRVRGTQFDVQNFRENELTVTVTEGVVQVSPAGAAHGASPLTLTAGNQLVLTADGARVTRLDDAALDDALAWRQGYVVFAGVPLETALRRFGRHHGIGISCTPEAAGLRVGGRFALDDLNGFFVALEEVLPVRVDRGLNGTVRVSSCASER